MIAIAGDEVLSQSDRTRVVRRFVPGGSIVCKEPLGRNAATRLRHETATLARLSGVAGVVKLSSADQGPLAIALVDDHGSSLAGSLRGERFALAALPEFALLLARTFAAMHRIGVVHRNVNPSNIVIARAGSRPILIDFCAAASSVGDGADMDPPADFEGSLAYMAPEQTGRTGRTVDQRADLYSLGIVMYELATGGRPFAGDDFQLIRDQLLRPPVAPNAVDPNVSPALSGLIMRLLQKEPEQRYQSAEGLAADLVSLIERRNAGVTAAFPLAERDFPQRLVPPARIVGRDTELAELDRAFSDALAGRANVLLIEGAAGVGKTALVNELRSLVTVNDGLFVSGTFDRLQHDSEADAVAIAFRGLFRLLLTEPEDVLVEFRSRLLATIGDAAPYVGALFPEAAMLLGVDPHVAGPDPLEALVHSSPNAINGGVDIVKCLASAARPIVFVVEDWQWASATALRFLDAVVTASSAPGFLFIGTYRAANGDGTDAVLRAAFLRWKLLGVMPARFSLGNLGLPDLGSLLQGMLRLAVEPAGRLARIVYSRTAGNPYDSIELINALRVDGALAIGAAGWTWDEETIRHYVGHGNVVDLLATRIAALPAGTRTVLEIGSCLGGTVALALLQTAADLPNVEALEQALVPALDDGLMLLVTDANASVRFRHERVQQAAYDRLPLPERIQLHLVVARRLLRVPEYEGSAAEQYLPAAGELHDPAEMLRVCGLFRRAAARERAGFNDSLVERFTAAAVALVRSTPNAEPGLQALLEAELHAALYRLARFAEGDAVYAQLAERCPDPLRIVDSACVQISSLTNRMLGDRAMTLGLDLLNAVGFGIPAAAELARVVEERLDAVSSWCDDDTAEARDALRPETADARVGAAAKLLSRLAPSGFFAGDERVRWLVLESFELWTAHGPCAALVHPLSWVGFIMIDARADYHRAYRITRRVLCASEARRYDAGTALARFNFSIGLAHWFEPFQACIAEARRARDELVRVGDMQFASFTYFASIQLLLESAASIDDVLREADAGIAFCLRSGNDQARGSYLAYRGLARSLTATTDSERLFTDQSFGQEAHVAGLVGNPVATLSYHTARAMSAALFGRSADLIVHADAAFPLISTVQAPSTALVHLFKALALARRIHGASTQDRPALLSALDRSWDWLQHRAEDAPDSYAHAVRLIAAERAWALDDSEGASSAFEAALLNIPATLAPWNRALTEERAALFYLGHGLMRYGRSLLLEAHGHYADWGAGAKVRQLELAYPFLRDVPPERAHSTAEAGVADAVDMVAILRASQALSSETSLGSLTARVVDVLAGLTGATNVNLAVRREGTEQWLFIPAAGAAQRSLDDAAASTLLPLSVFRFVERTRVPLLSADALLDDRFARDPYFVGCKHCSLLVVPISSQGELRAMLFLENRLGRDAFSTGRLDIVLMIAGQLAVSIDNALLYTFLEEKVGERTAALAAANKQLASLSLTDGLTGLVNRRGFDEQLEIEWHRAERLKTPLGLAMADIDHFKVYNDTYGHLAGDECLRRIGATIAASVRPGVDIAARYGGEEFALILPGSDADGTYSAGERLRTAVAALREGDGTRGLATISIGVISVVPVPGQHAAAALERADRALYRAKDAGRNCVVRA